MYATHQSAKMQFAAFATAIALALTAGSAAGVTQSKEKRNMKRVGHTDLQGRPAYQPNVIKYPDGRWIAFVGTHNNIPVPRAGFTFLPNPLKNPPTDEPNGMMIIDVTDPKKPVEKFHIPVPVAGGQSQSVRMCLGSKLPGGTSGNVYMLRNIQGSSASGYQVWDVTNVEAPVLKSSLTGLRSTHKPWWECSTGIAYLPGSKNTPPLWNQSQAMLVYDWSNPNMTPTYIRTFGLPGGEPGSTAPTPNSLHGAISAHEHPNATTKLTRGAGPNDVIGNRIYAAWGVGDDGVMTIIDRKKLLPAAYGGSWVPGPGFLPGTTNADSPFEADLIGATSPTVGYFLMSPDQGGHTSMPVFGLAPPSYQSFAEFKTRDVVLLASESTSDLCDEPPHFSFVVDVTVENSMTAPPGTRPLRDIYQGPMVLSSMSVDPRAGDKFKRGNYCTRGARFGVHSSEENFEHMFYGKLTAIAYFTGGVRIWDIREPQAPKEVAFYVPESNANTNPDGYMTNNVEIDKRGFIYVVDRNGAGFDILELTGCAKDIVPKDKFCTDLDNDNVDD